MMKQKFAWVAGFAVLFAVGMIAVSGAFTDASGESGQKPSAPQYSETCSHGHNGFPCKTPQYKIDISELQEKTVDLERRITQLEKR